MFFPTGPAVISTSQNTGYSVNTCIPPAMSSLTFKLKRGMPFTPSGCRQFHHVHLPTADSIKGTNFRDSYRSTKKPSDCMIMLNVHLLLYAFEVSKSVVSVEVVQ